MLFYSRLQPVLLNQKDMCWLLVPPTNKQNQFVQSFIASRWKQATVTPAQLMRRFMISKYELILR
jgi:hypothetical protein